jgi:integrase
VSAISWAHSLAGLETPTRNPLVLETINGLKRKLARPSVRKEPFEREHIHKLIEAVNTDSITDVRNTLIIVLAYFAFLRVDELRHVENQHLKISSSHLEITLPRSKCDQLRQGTQVLIARLGGKYCPIKLLEYYITLKTNVSNETDSGSQYFFRRLLVKKSGITLTDKVVPMTYSNIRDVVKRKATQLGLDPKRFGTHSMRAGGATTAANSLVADRIFQKHGRWATSSSKDRYVKDSETQRLEVSKAIG